MRWTVSIVLTRLLQPANLPSLFQIWTSCTNFTGLPVPVVVAAAPVFQPAGRHATLPDQQHPAAGQHKLLSWAATPAAAACLLAPCKARHSTVHQDNTTQQISEKS